LGKKNLSGLGFHENKEQAREAIYSLSEKQAR